MRYLIKLLGRFLESILTALERALGISHAYYYPATRGLIISSVRHHRRTTPTRKTVSKQRSRPLARASAVPLYEESPLPRSQSLAPLQPSLPRTARPPRLRIDAQGRLREDERSKRRR